jgi:hypothetical protein
MYSFSRRYTYNPFIGCFKKEEVNKGVYTYNYRGLVDNLFKIKEYDENKFLCSEFVYHILEKNKIVDLNLPRNLVRPQNLYSFKSEIIYKGNLKSFGKIDNIINNYEVNVGRLSIS